MCPKSLFIIIPSEPRVNGFLFNVFYLSALVIQAIQVIHKTSKGGEIVKNKILVRLIYFMFLSYLCCDVSLPINNFPFLLYDLFTYLTYFCCTVYIGGEEI